MAPEDRDKTAFITEWGAFASNVMNFGLKNAPPTFQEWIQEVFAPFLTSFIECFWMISVYLAILKIISIISNCVLRNAEWHGWL